MQFIEPKQPRSIVTEDNGQLAVAIPVGRNPLHLVVIVFFLLMFVAIGSRLITSDWGGST